MSGMLFLMFVQGLFQFGVKRGNERAITGRKIFLTCPLERAPYCFCIWSNQLSWLVENDRKEKSGYFYSFSSGFRKILLPSDVELSRQAENDRMERFRHHM